MNDKEKNMPDFNSADALSSRASVLSGVAAKGWMQAGDSRSVEATVSANDLTSLSALITYVAFHAGENEFGVARRLADRFNVANVNCLPASQFDNAIRYLVDHMVEA